MAFLLRAGLLETQVALSKFLLKAGVPPVDLKFTLDFFKTRNPEDLKNSIDKLWSLVSKYGLSEEAANAYILKGEKAAQKWDREFVKPFIELHFENPTPSKLREAQDWLMIEDDKWKPLMKGQPLDYLRFTNEADADEAMQLLQSRFKLTKK